MADGSSKRCDAIQKGDVVRTPEGSGTIRCVLETTMGVTTEVVAFPSGLIVTPWHPIRHQGEWVFPAAVGKIESRHCASVFR